MRVGDRLWNFGSRGDQRRALEDFPPCTAAKYRETVMKRFLRQRSRFAGSKQTLRNICPLREIKRAPTECERTSESEETVRVDRGE